MKLFSALNPILLILYAGAVMSMILDVRPSALSRQKRLLWIAFTGAVLAVSALVMLTVGQPTYGRLYILLVHLPFFVQFSLLSRYRGVKVLFALLSTVVFTSPPFLFTAAARTYLHIGPTATAAVYVLGYAVVLAVTWRFLKADFNYIMEHGENAQFWMFCAIPILYYLYTFNRTKYNFTQAYDSDGFWFRQLPIIIVLVSYLLLVRIFRSVRETQRLHSEAALTHAQMEAANLRLQELNRTQAQTRQYRHDMRHHFTFLQALAAEGDLEQISQYLHTAQSDLDAFTPARYCENETANLLLSSLMARARQSGVTLTAEAQLPPSLPLSDTELCSLLSNSLENAICAAAQCPEPENRTVRLRSRVFQSKLLLSVENPYVGQVLMKDGLPQPAPEGQAVRVHGYGTRCIADIVDAHFGQFLFTAQDGLFSLKLVIPLL